MPAPDLIIRILGMRIERADRSTTHFVLPCLLQLLSRFGSFALLGLGISGLLALVIAQRDFLGIGSEYPPGLRKGLAHGSMRLAETACAEFVESPPTAGVRCIHWSVIDEDTHRTIQEGGALGWTRPRRPRSPMDSTLPLAAPAMGELPAWSQVDRVIARYSSKTPSAPSPEKEQPPLSDVLINVFESEYACGYPYPVFWKLYELDWGTVAGSALPSWMMVDGGCYSGSLFIPTSVYWSGAVINGLIYGAITWCAVVGVRAIVAFRRRRHGKCIYCGYDRRYSSMCPECGR